MGTRVAKHIARELYDSRSRLASLHEVSSSYTTMEVEGELLEVSELQRDVLYLEEKHAEAFDMSCMSPPLSPSPILSPNTPSTELPSAFQFRFKIDTSSEFEAGMLDAADSLKDNFLTMNARVTSPGAARVKNEWSRVETAGTVHEVQVTEANSGEQDALSAEGEDLALPAESECSPNAILTTLEYAAYAPGEEQSEVSSPGSNGPEGRPEVDIAVDKHPIDVTHDAEGSDIDLDIEKLALEIEAHNRATSNAVMVSLKTN